MRKNILALSLALFFFAGALPCVAEDSAGIPRGIWVSVFAKDRPLYSREDALRLIEKCKESGISQIYLQVYQSGRAYYDSAIADRAKYEEMVKSAGGDMVSFIIKEASAVNIKVFAWVNLLSLGQNDKADIINKFGRDVLTRDQFGRPSGRENPNESDKYYLREEIIFLEPGDQRVAKYLLSVVEELIKRYPSLSGVHLDYLRYPMTVPFIPGSKFTKFGLSYGYGPRNAQHFKEWTGIDPLDGLKDAKDCMLWDNWRRDQITSLARRMSKAIKEKSPALLVSCAVVTSAERAYSSMFQDWPLWLEEGFIDYVVLMNYTLDNRLSKELLRSSLAHRGRGKVFAGIGPYLMKDDLPTLIAQYKQIAALSPDGIVIFSYDDLDEALTEILLKP